MKRPLRTHGFTLVEAVVVSVIIAIVGIAAVVAYSGFIRESRRQAVEGIAQTAAVAASAYVRKVGNDDDLDSAHLGLFLTNPTDYNISVNNTDCDGLHGSVRVVETKDDGIEVTKYY